MMTERINLYVIIAVIFIVLGIFTAIFSGKKTRRGVKKVVTSAAIEKKIKEVDTSDEALFAVKYKVSGQKFTSLTEAENFKTALFRRELKKRLREEHSFKSRLKRKILNSGGMELREARILLSEKKYKRAISKIKEALLKAGNNKTIKMAGYRMLAMAYESQDEIPRYCFYMYKFLQLAEKSIDEPEKLEKVGRLKVQFQESVKKFKAKGFLK